ncbi:hypothetical protein D3C76_655850 [compost metagenome]
MKAVPKVNTDGLYIEDTLVDDAFSGVVPFYADPPAQEQELPPDTDSTDDPEQQEEAEPSGYIVGVPVPQGLYHPRFDLVAWEAREEGGTSDYWIEGLTSQEIEELTRARPQEPSEIDRLRAENTELKLAITELAEANENDKTETQLALAELAALITGGGDVTNG